MSTIYHAKIPISIPRYTKLLHLQRDVSLRTWNLWIAESPDGRFGTYLELHADGAIYRVTTRGDQGDERNQVKPADRV